MGVGLDDPDLTILRAITKAKDEERLNIARELHDSTIQELIAILLQVEGFVHKNQQFNMDSLRFFWNLESQLRTVLKDLRNLSQNLRPSILEHLGLLPALEYLKDSLWNNYGIKVHIMVKQGLTGRFQPNIENNIYRVIQEGLNNVARHSGAQEAEVIIQTIDDTTTLIIRDRGKGFNYTPTSLERLASQGKMGLRGIAERIKLMGGSMLIESGCGKGTSLIINLPNINNK